MTLSQAVGIAVANNQDQYVTVNAAESFEYLIVQNKGIYDPLINAAVNRSHAEIPAASQLTGGVFDDTSFSGSVSQFTPLGGTFTLGFNGLREKTNNPFSTVNPFVRRRPPTVDEPAVASKFRHAAVELADPDRAQLARLGLPGTSADRAGRPSTPSSRRTGTSSMRLQNLEVKRESLRIAQELNRITRIKIDVGSLAPIDITQTEVGIATAEQDIIISEGQIGDAQDRLKRLLNFVDAAQVNVPIIPDGPALDGAGEDPARRGHADGAAAPPGGPADRVHGRFGPPPVPVLPQSDAARLEPHGLLRATAGSRDSRSTRIPGVVTDTNFSQTFRDVFDRNSKSWSIGLNFSYPILNRAARGAAGVARYTWESDRAQMSVVEQNVIVEVRTAARAIDTAQRSIVAATKGRELAERNLDAEKKKFDNGMSTTFQVNQIQRDLSAARTAEQQALAVYRKALAQYHFAISDNLDWKGIRVEGLPESEPPVVNIEGGVPAQTPPPVVR